MGGVIGGKGSGRKPDYQEALEALSRAMSIHGEASPIVQEAMAELLAAMRYSGPYARTRFQAVCRVLDTFVGRPREAPKQGKGDARGAISKLMDDIGGDDS